MDNEVEKLRCGRGGPMMAIKALLAAEAAIYAAFMALDLFFPRYGRVSSILKLAGVALALALSAVSLASARDRRGGRLVVLALSLTLLSDAILLFTAAHALGVAIFCLVHIAYIARFRPSAARPCAAVAAGVIAFCAAEQALGWGLPHLFILCGLYAALILAAAYLAFRSPLPRAEAIPARAGMVLFLLCDVSVALFNLLPGDAPLHGFASIAMWGFYLPSQALLALSARGLGARRP